MMPQLSTRVEYRLLTCRSLQVSYKFLQGNLSPYYYVCQKLQVFIGLAYNLQAPTS